MRKVYLVGSIVVIDFYMRMVEQIIEMWVWLIYLDFGVVFLGLGEMKYWVLGERKYFCEKDLVDDFEVMMMIMIVIGDKNVYDDVEIVILIVVGVVVVNWNVIVGNVVQIGVDVMIGFVCFMVMIEIFLGVFVDFFGVEVQRLLGVSLVMMNYELIEDWIKRVFVIMLFL